MRKKRAKAANLLKARGKHENANAVTEKMSGRISF
jgi:hypothetical protein